MRRQTGQIDAFHASNVLQEPYAKSAGSLSCNGERCVSHGQVIRSRLTQFFLEGSAVVFICVMCTCHSDGRARKIVAFTNSVTNSLVTRETWADNIITKKRLNCFSKLNITELVLQLLQYKVLSLH